MAWLLTSTVFFIASTAGAATFVDVSQARGINLHQKVPFSGNYPLPEIMGSGVAVFDYDGDGLLDLLIADQTPPGARLYRQNRDHTFRDATADAGLSATGGGMGVSLGDVNNDGYLDVYLTSQGPDTLLENNGDGTFTDVTARSKIRITGWSASAAFCDINVDGFLDLFVTRYVTPDHRQRCRAPDGTPDYCSPDVFSGLSDRLYLNNSDGTFKDVTVSSGIATRSARGLGVVCHDLNGDHQPDIYVANDGESNHLWLNQGQGTFVEDALAWGVATNLFGQVEAGMGIALGDVNDDREPDIFLTHVDGETNTLYLTTPGPALVDATIPSRLGPVSLPSTGFGTAFLDMDQDGDLDLAVANGRVRRPNRLPTPGEDFSRIYGETNLLFRQRSGAAFAAVFETACANEDFCLATEVSRGLIARDLDNDGDLDLLVTNSDGPVQLFENTTPAPGNWLKVRALDHGRDAIGATVRITTGDHSQQRPVIHTTSYLSSGAATVHFGIGESTLIDLLEVVWLDGTLESFSVDFINGTRTVERSTGYR